MDNIYVHADLLRVYKAILNATQDIALWLRGNTRKQLLTNINSKENWIP